MLSYCHLKTFYELVAGIQCEVATQPTAHLISEDIACVAGCVSLSPPSGGAWLCTSALAKISILCVYFVHDTDRDFIRPQEKFIEPSCIHKL